MPIRFDKVCGGTLIHVPQGRDLHLSHLLRRALVLYGFKITAQPGIDPCGSCGIVSQILVEGIFRVLWQTQVVVAVVCETDGYPFAPGFQGMTGSAVRSVGLLNIASPYNSVSLVPGCDILYSCWW